MASFYVSNNSVFFVQVWVQKKNTSIEEKENIADLSITRRVLSKDPLL